MRRLRDLIHPIELEIFVVDSFLDGVNLSFGHFTDPLSEFFEGVDEGGRVGDHSSHALPALLFVLVSGGLEDHDGDAQSCDLLGWLCEGLKVVSSLLSTTISAFSAFQFSEFALILHSNCKDIGRLVGMLHDLLKGEVILLKLLAFLLQCCLMSSLPMKMP